MQIIIEGYQYPAGSVDKVLWEGAFQTVDGKVSIGYVGYYWNDRLKDSVIDAEMFVNKVAFYLWNDVFKDCELDGDAFKITREDGEVDVLAFQDFFKEDGTINEEVLKNFLTKLMPPPEQENGAAPQAGTGA